MQRTLPTVITLLALSGMTSPVFAEKPERVVTISEVTIVGRVEKPIAAVDVSRLQPKLTLSQMKTTFLELIEKAVHKDPF
jgi:hypothetical protein